MSDFPSIKEEINRKSFETLQKIVEDHNLGKISNGQFKYASDVAWLLVSGLISEDVFHIFEALGEETKTFAEVERTYYRHQTTGENAVIFDFKNGYLALKIIRTSIADVNKGFDLRDEPNPYLSAKNKKVELDTYLQNNGFIKI